MWVRPRRPLTGSLHSRHDFPGLREKHFASRGERHVALAAIQQGDAYVRLQMLDLLAKRGLRCVEPLCGTRKVQLFGDRDEVPQVAQLHGFHPWRLV